MRIIKFRGKRIDNGECAYGYYYAIKLASGNLQHLINDETGLNEYEVILETVGQFTGLHDKNGKEIYEGEILYNNDREEHCIVKYSKEKAMFIVKYLESNDEFPLWESISNLYYSVGNIYEHSHLIDNN